MTNLKINYFNKNQSILLATGGGENNLSKDTQVIAAKPFAHYKKGDAIPSNDPYLQAVLEELQQEQIPEKETEKKVANAYDVKLTPDKQLRCLCKEYDVSQNGSKMGHISSSRFQFSPQELSAKVANILGAPNKLPVKLRFSISPDAQKIMDKNNMTLSGSNLTKSGKALLDFSQDKYEDTNMAIYISTPKDQPGKIKIITIEVDREQQSGILDPVTGNMSDVEKFSLVH